MKVGRYTAKTYLQRYRFSDSSEFSWPEFSQFLFLPKFPAAVNAIPIRATWTDNGY